MTHQPNTPRQRNSKGQKVDEPVQCVQCLQAWPCEVMLLSQQVIALASENSALRAERDDLRERVHELLDRPEETDA
jgi:regulator of replication initiation timing